MKIVKYYYGKPTYVETMTGLTKENGDYLEDSVYVIQRKPRARITVCGIYDTDTNVMTIGVSRCSHKDVFVKETGKKLAYERALSTPTITCGLMNNERMSSVFFEQAKLLDKRYSNANFIKF